CAFSDLTDMTVEKPGNCSRHRTKSDSREDASRCGRARPGSFDCPVWTCPDRGRLHQRHSHRRYPRLVSPGRLLLEGERSAATATDLDGIPESIARSSDPRTR